MLFHPHSVILFALLFQDDSVISVPRLPNDVVGDVSSAHLCTLPRSWMKVLSQVPAPTSDQTNTPLLNSTCLTPHQLLPLDTYRLRGSLINFMWIEMAEWKINSVVSSVQFSQLPHQRWEVLHTSRSVVQLLCFNNTLGLIAPKGLPKPRQHLSVTDPFILNNA